MNKGSVLKVRAGHDANCSSYAYMGHVLVSYVGYLVFLLVLIATQVALRFSRLAARPWSRRLRIAAWVIPHLVAMPALWIWASSTGMTRYGTVVSAGVLELVLLISLGVGWVTIAKGG